MVWNQTEEISLTSYQLPHLEHVSVLNALIIKKKSANYNITAGKNIVVIIF